MNSPEARRSQGRKQQAGEARELLPIVSFDPTKFPFKQIVPDDGQDESGG
ncbi:MAG: hypothetical protein QM820_58865 [Minicystis sp.]